LNERDRPRDVEALYGVLDVREDVLECQLGRMHADDFEAVLVVGAPGEQIGISGAAVTGPRPTSPDDV
jgi:hypothetical protein